MKSILRLNTSIIVASVFFLSSNALFAKPIDLICEKRVDERELSSRLYNWDMASSKTCPSDYYLDCEGDLYDKQTEIWEHCRTSELAYELRFRLETDNLKDGEAGFTSTISTVNCPLIMRPTSGYYDDRSFISERGAAPPLLAKKSWHYRVSKDVLQFSEANHFRLPVVVDRKTLNAEDKSKPADMNCRVEDAVEDARPNLL